MLNLENKAGKKSFDLRRECDELERSADNYRRKAERIESDIKRIDEQIKTNRRDDAELVAAWKEIKTGGQVCRTCGQQLPPSQVERHLADIATKGGKLAAEHERLQKDRAAMVDEIKRCEFGVAETSQQAEVLARKAEAARIVPGKAEIEAQIATLAEVIEKEIQGIGPEKERLEAALSDLEKQVGREREKLLSITQAVKTQDRIRQKEAALKLAAAEFEECERKLYLLELYGGKRSEYIEETVSQKFEITSWKLFEEQINAGSREICEPVYQGVPYSTDLNTGAKIQVGLDCIKTLSRHHGVTMPVFIDNAESVTNWMIDIDNQMIRLQAMPNVEKLEVKLTPD